MGETLSKDIYTLLFNSATEGMAVIDTSGVIKLTNPRLNSMFGYKQNELVGKTIEALIPKSYRSMHVQHRRQYVKTPSRRSMGIDMDLAGVKQDGTEFPVEVSLNHVGKGEKLMVMALITDITERRNAKEELMRLNEELESRVQARTKELDKAISALQFSNEDLHEEIIIRRIAEEKARQALEKERELNELKTRFVSMASHEFRTPLSTVLTSVSLIAKYDGKADKAKRDKHINRIRSSVRNLTSILNDFLSLDKLEQGAVEINNREFDITELCEDIVEEMQAVTKSGQIIKYRHTGRRNTFRTDVQLLKNIVVNLFSNAIKYSAEGRTILLSTKAKMTSLEVSVSDEGIGIPKADQRHMFEKFFRAKNSLNIQGTGLGLNIVQRYLSLLNGKIRFESEENIGTTFIFEVPENLERTVQGNQPS